MQEKQYLQAATALHGYIVQAHWNGESLTGPDPRIRFNTRVGRFVKSYVKGFPWSDDLTYMQAQGYWIFSNWQLFDLTGNQEAKQIALACSENVIEMQASQGCWAYPNPEWKGRFATVEGCFATLGLLESYARVQDERFLDAARQWFDFLVSEIGFRHQQYENMWAINYFAHQTGDGGGVPNNSTLVLWLLARLHELTGESKFSEPCDKLVAWLRHVQLSSGELPYALGETANKDTTHFLCFQYNAFEFMDLVYYQKMTADTNVQPVIESLASYLSTGLTAEGRARFDCSHTTPDVLYYTVAIARALSLATDLNLGDYRVQADQAFQQALSHQRTDGGFTYHSRKNYGCLTDSRSYPRYLSMVLHHLLLESQPRRIAAESSEKMMVSDARG